MKSKQNHKIFYNQKKRKRTKRIITNISTFSLLLVIGYIICQIYLTNRCKDLQYAVDYYLTSGNEEDRLLRVKNITLVFSDKDTAVIEAYGLNKSKPHATTAIEGHFRKDSFDSWKLENTYIIEN